MKRGEFIRKIKERRRRRIQSSKEGRKEGRKASWKCHGIQGTHYPLIFREIPSDCKTELHTSHKASFLPDDQNLATERISNTTHANESPRIESTQRPTHAFVYYFFFSLSNEETER
jgi:hypothetical protein